jgi:antibiotic biosynthesis monooxygenase (ABM) superfamily enzyme
MLVRQALFEGAIHSGRETAFDAYVEATMLPLWRRFPGVREVRVLRERERDAGMPEVAMVLSMTFDDAAALQAALDSPVRVESRAATQGLLAMFDGRVRHHVFELAHADG